MCDDLINWYEKGRSSNQENQSLVHSQWLSVQHPVLPSCNKRVSWNFRGRGAARVQRTLLMTSTVVHIQMWGGKYFAEDVLQEVELPSKARKSDTERSWAHKTRSLSQLAVHPHKSFQSRDSTPLSPSRWKTIVKQTPCSAVGTYQQRGMIL